MSTSDNLTIDLSANHAAEDLYTGEDLNFNRVVALMVQNDKINAVMKLEYKRASSKRYNRVAKLNVESVNWFMRMAEFVASRCGNPKPILTINWDAVDAIEDELAMDTICELFDRDTRISHINYQLKLIKTTTGKDNNQCFDVVLERVMSLGGYPSPSGKQVYRFNFSVSNRDFYKSLAQDSDSHGDEDLPL